MDKVWDFTLPEIEGVHTTGMTTVTFYAKSRTEYDRLVEQINEQCSNVFVHEGTRRGVSWYEHTADGTQFRTLWCPDLEHEELWAGTGYR